MSKQPLNKGKILDLISDIERGIEELRSLVNVSREEFIADKKSYGLAEHYLRRALEGVLTVGTHIVSRSDGKAKDYQEIITALGKQGVITFNFAERNRKLAGYRNRLVHLYWEVTPPEMYDIIKEHLPDLESFAGSFKAVVSQPGKFGFSLE